MLVTCNTHQIILEDLQEHFIGDCLISLKRYLEENRISHAVGPYQINERYIPLIIFSLESTEIWFKIECDGSEHDITKISILPENQIPLNNNNQ